MLWALVIGWEPWNSTKGTRGVPTPKSLEATATDSADGPDCETTVPAGVGALTAPGAAEQPARPMAANRLGSINNRFTQTFFPGPVYFLLPPACSISRSKTAFTASGLIP